MLATNKLSMDQRLKSLYDIFEDAAYKAYYNQLKSKFDNSKADIQDAELSSIIASETVKLENEMKNDAAQFANDFCNALKKGKLLETISDEIDGHVKSIKLMINIPALLPTIVSPMGPCTGALNISEETGAQIQIL